MDVLMLKPVFKDAIWGGKLLSDFGYKEAGDSAGECWGISAHKNGDCTVMNGEFAGKTLSWCWENHRELFGNMEGDVFPLLIKILGAEDDLSIQVHPKNATDKDELADMIHNARWNELIREVPIKKGDFFQINPGCLHAIKGGTLLIETQQSSDVTYRVYDYDRLQNGKPRELHVQQSIDCIVAPHEDFKQERVVKNFDGMTSTRLVKCPYYTLEKWDVDGKYTFKMDKNFMNVSVIEGNGKVNGREISKGDHFIIPSLMEECTLE